MLIVTYQRSLFARDPQVFHCMISGTTLEWQLEKREEHIEIEIDRKIRHRYRERVRDTERKIDGQRHREREREKERERESISYFLSVRSLSLSVTISFSLFHSISFSLILFLPLSVSLSTSVFLFPFFLSLFLLLRVSLPLVFPQTLDSFFPYLSPYPPPPQIPLGTASCKGHCAGLANSCDQRTGHCTYGCDPGYIGSTCEAGKMKPTWPHLTIDKVNQLGKTSLQLIFVDNPISL